MAFDVGTQWVLFAVVGGVSLWRLSSQSAYECVKASGWGIERPSPVGRFSVHLVIEIIFGVVRVVGFYLLYLHCVFECRVPIAAKDP